MSDTSARPVEGRPTQPVDCPLVGEDGNAFFIMGRLDKALRVAGASPEYRKAVQSDMTSGDYDHLLGVALREIDGEIAADLGDEAEGEEADFGFIMGLRG
jgi:hypothetical protein